MEDLGPNTWLIEEMRQTYKRDPSSLSEVWRRYFEDETASTHSKAAPKPTAPSAPATSKKMIGAGAALVKHMTKSLEIPTATSVRAIPAKLLEVNRNILNNHLKRAHGGKVSFTHLIGWAILQAVAKHPEMKTIFDPSEEGPTAMRPEHVNMGLAVDVTNDAGRSLVVPNIKNADSLVFAEFFNAYEDVIRKVRARKLAPDDLAGTTMTITNPGMIGTVHSVPRLMSGQSVIIGVGSIEYPAEFRGTSEQALAQLGVGKVVTLTSTYDHRVIQGASSGEFLGEIDNLLTGEDGFYEEIFRSMGVPYVPVDWKKDSLVQDEHGADAQRQVALHQLINLYRVRGHLIAGLDPLQAEPPKMHPDLDPARHGFSIWDLDREFQTAGFAGQDTMKLSGVLRVLRDAYCRGAGVEYMHTSEVGEKEWMQENVEGVPTEVSREDQARILKHLNAAEAFETFLHKKYVGHKRFSLEGAEALIPTLGAILDGAPDSGVDEVVLGLAHRGRLNVLANICGRSYEEIFREFEGDLDPESAHGSGDVRYHLGAEGEYETAQGDRVKVTIAPNPSHLESVNPVVEGMVRAKQDASNPDRCMAILIHGDAAVAGQGVVAETLNLSKLPGYRTGGTIHIVVNNQLGFTTAPGQARSSTYATDVAKMIQAPIFHVNGEDPEACIRVARLACAYRIQFHKDVFIDMWCYRKWGHNEIDEPSFTQPIMYRRIAGRPSVRRLYTEALLHRRELTLEEAEHSLKEFNETLQHAFDTSKESRPTAKTSFMRPVGILPVSDTAAGRAALEKVLDQLTQVPAGFDLHPKLAKWLESKKRSFDEAAIDFALSESLAFGTLLLEGTSIRLTGQDTRRGTFSQRHSVLVDQTTGAEHTPLVGFASEGVRFDSHDSLLSEFAALGFEYGYSVAAQEALVLWEAQFGDFSNEAQVIIDQFIASGEDKWGQQSNIVLLLPHGYEGQGPEHSSGRLERFLQLGAGGNIQVVVPSAPKQYFHLLRRQGRAKTLRPLVVMTPKSLLRLPAARSSVDELTEGRFDPVIGDTHVPDKARRVILCSGKIYWELHAERNKRNLSDIAIVRVEQLYPFPADEIAEAISPHADAEMVWVQEEPANMGAWRFMHHRFSERLDIRLFGRTREASPSPATGSAITHAAEQSRLMDQALGR